MTAFPHGAHWLTLLAPPAAVEGPDRTRRRLERALAAVGAVSWEWEFGARKTGLAASAAPPGLQPALVEDLPAAVHPADRDWLERAVAAAARGEAPYDFEFRLRGADGRTEWVHDLGHLERDAAGRPLRLAGVARLVTARKRAEAALHATFEQAPIGMAHVSLGGAFTRVNDRLCGFLDRPREVLLSLGFQDVTHAADLAADLALVDDLLAGRAQTYTLEKRYLRGDGAVARGRLTVSLARDADGAPDHFVSLVEDMAERRTGHEGADTPAADARRDMLAALAAREAELARVQRIGRIGGFEVDLRDPAFMAWRSPEDRVLHALAPGLSGESHEAWLARLHPEDRARADATLRAALASGGTRYENEYRIVRPDGQTRWIAAMAEIERDPAGRLLRLVGAHQDITDRKQAELALAESEAFATGILAAASDCIVVLDAEDRVAYMNEPGRCQKEIDDLAQAIGRPVLSLWPAEAVPEIRAALTEARASGTARYTAFGPTVKGTPKWWEVTVTRLRSPDGGESRLLSVARDITERKRAEAALAEAEREASARLDEQEAVYATAPVGLAVLTIDLRYLRINERLAEINGLPAAAHIGRTMREIVPDLADRAEALVRRILETGEPALNLEFTGETRAQPGVRRTWIASWTPVRGLDGAIAALNVVAEEVTERRAAEARERRMLQIFERSNDLVAMTGLNLQLTYMNAGGRRMIGLDETADVGDLRGSDYVAPESLALFREVVIPTARDKGFWEGEMRLVNLRTGAPIDVYRAFFALRDPDGTHSGYGSVSRDITPEKRAAEALAESEAFARTVLESSPDCLKVVGFDGTLEYLSQNGACLLELDDCESVVGGKWEALWPDDQRPAIREAIAAARDGRSVRFTAAAPTAKGTPKVWDVAVTPVPGPDGRTARLIAASRDITAQEAARTALAESEARYRAALQAGGLGTWEADRASGQRTWTPEGMALFGLDLPDGIGRIGGADDELYLRMHPDDRRLLADYRRDLLAEGAITVEYRIVLPNGDVRWIAGRGTTLTRDAAGKPVRTIHIAADVTARKRAEQALRASEAKFRTAFDNSSLPMSIISQRDVVYRDVNRACADLFGLARGDMIGRSPRELDLYSDPAQRPVLRALLERDGHVHDFEIGWRTREGELRTHLLSADPISLVGEPCLYVVSNDITGRKQVEAALAESEARLRLAMSTAALGTIEWDLAAGTIRVDAGTEALTRGLFQADRPFRLDGPERAAWGARTHPADLPRRHALRAAIVAGETDTSEDEYRIRLPGDGDGDGEDWHWIASRSAVVAWDPAGRALRILDVLQDITPRRWAEAALADSEALFRATFDQAAIGVAHVGLDGRWLRVNTRVSAMLGYSEAELLEKTFQDITHPDDLEAGFSGMRAMLAGKIATFSLEKRYRRKDGTVLWVNTAASLLRDAGGAPRNFVALLEDISARKAAEAALAESEARLRLAMSTAALGTVEWDLAAGTFQVDAGTEAIMGGLFPANRLFSVDGAERAAWGARCHLDDRTRRRALRAAIVAGETDAFENEYRIHLPGEGEDWHWIASRSAVVARDAATGRALRILDVLEDITPRRQAEAALADSEALFRATFDQARIGVAHVGLDGRWLRVNGRLCAMLGYSEAELLEQTFQDITHPDDLEADIDRVRALLAGEIATYATEKRYFRKDGAVLWINLTVSMLRDPGGAPRNFVSIVADISARKAAEAALAESESSLRRLNEELETRVQEEVATREDAQTRMAHAERMEALGQLAGGIAHDFNNVLQALGGGAALIERRPNDTERVRGLARMMAEAVGRGAAITRRLLYFARRADLRAEPIDPALLLEGMREILAHTLGSGLEVRAEAPEGLPLLLADKGQLETALVNLATNGRDAMGGLGTLTLAAAAETVPSGEGASGDRSGAPPDLKPGTYVRLSVSDSGAGMDSATLTRAMEPFFTTKPQDKGTGLGLSMVNGFVLQSGGDLRIDSAQGRGTTVMLWFPAVEGETPAPAASGTEAVPLRHGRRARLMLVDDEAIVREIVSAQMEEAGYAVLALESGAAALARLDAGEAVDLIVSDLSMPGMDGVTLLREARRRCPGLPAILLTGFVTTLGESDLDETIGGAFLLLRKPIEGKALAERVAVLLEGLPIR
jgi:PAS domain S-box-containing protein